MDIKVLKRNGEQEQFNLSKIHRVIEWAVQGLKGVSVEEIEINAKLNIREGISTEEIHKVVIESAANLISIEKHNYQFVAARLFLYQLRKQVWGGKTPPRLLDVIKTNIGRGSYDPNILEKYSEAEINKLGEYIDHDRDLIFTYAGIKQLSDKYLIRNRFLKETYETPQFAYMVLAMAGFIKYPEKSRLQYIKRAYNFFSKHKINLATPIMAGLRSNLKSYSSCCLIEIDDTKESLTASATAISLATANRYGIGIGVGRIRPLGSPVNNGQIIHTGLIPFLKIYEASVKAWQQNAIRGGSATCNIPWWHYEIEDVIVLKNNAGTDDNRVRKLDYTVGFSKLFYERLQKGENITLFSPHESKEVFESFGLSSFDQEYIKAENNPDLKFKKVIPAKQLASLFAKERTETGRIYVLNVDLANSHSPFNKRILQSNLCLEVQHCLTPINDINDKNGEIGVCILSAVNVLEIKNDDEFEKVCDVIVRLLEEIIDIQTYFCPAAENFAKKWRSLGIGLTNVAALLAFNCLKYSSPEAPNLIDEWAEKLEYFCLKSSLDLAKERGKFHYWNDTKWSQGLGPLDHYKKSVDSVVTRKPSLDWQKIIDEIKEFGLRHSTLSCQMPVESSSVIQASTNGFEPVRSLIIYKDSKESRLPVLVPGVGKWHQNYELAFDIKDNKDIINVNAAFQKWADMAMSTNFYYNYSHFPDKKLPDSKVLQDVLYAYRMGLKSIYYSNSDDGDKEQSLESGCVDGACTL